MTLVGTLNDFDLFSIFNMIKSQKKRGVLLIENNDTRVKISFDQGSVIGIDTTQSLPEESISSILLRSNKVSFDEMRKLIQGCNNGFKRLEEIILESGLITSQDLQDVIHMQTMNIVYKVFLWTSGKYQFDPVTNGVFKKIDHFLPIPIDTILIEAAKFIDEWPRTQKRLPDRFQVLSKSASANTLLQTIDRDISKDITLLLNSDILNQFNAMNISREEENVLRYFEQPSSIDNIIKISKYYELDTCRYIVLLLEKGLLEISSCKSTTLPNMLQQINDIQKKQTEISKKPSMLFWLCKNTQKEHP